MAGKGNNPKPQQEQDKQDQSEKPSSIRQKIMDGLGWVVGAARRSQTMHEVHAIIDGGATEIANFMFKGEPSPFYGGGLSPAEQAMKGENQPDTAALQSDDQQKDAGVQNAAKKENSPAEASTSHGKQEASLGVVDSMMKEINPDYDPQAARKMVTSHGPSSELGPVDQAMADIQAMPTMQEPEQEMSK